MKAARSAYPEGGGGRRAGLSPVPILMYHAVADAPARAAYRLSVTPTAFAEQMGLLAARGCTPIGTRRLAAAWRYDRPLPSRPVLITFDDGYAGVHRRAPGVVRVP